MVNAEIINELMGNEEFNAKMHEAKTEQEFITLLNEYGVENVAEVYKEFMDTISKDGELNEEELDSVSGGGKGLVYYFEKFLDWLLKQCRK